MFTGSASAATLAELEERLRKIDEWSAMLVERSGIVASPTPPPLNVARKNRIFKAK